MAAAATSADSIPTTNHPTPNRALRARASALISPARFLSPAPRLRATSVCVPMPRKLNTQKMLDSTIVPTPSAASGAAPRREMNAVSASPVSGSATSDTSTGRDSAKNVRCGVRRKGCAFGRGIATQARAAPGSKCRSSPIHLSMSDLPG